ncbi:MAG: hypothetical protein GX442_16670 [Candidatus Riflebacteria bacterium]|nr:hypothetical protein [Candidatus Riflebacteria bacterium]
MICTRLEDWYERHGEEPFGPEWEDLLVHARSCPDCALAMQRRGELLETLRHLPAPEVPPQLGSLIGLALDGAPGAEAPDTTWFDEHLEPWLRPLQVGLAAACVVMTVFLGGLGREQPVGPASTPAGRLVARAPAIPRRPTPAPSPAPGERLVRISPEEVADFMRRLETYRRLHPEMDSHPAAGPAVQTVGFSGR